MIWLLGVLLSSRDCDWFFFYLFYLLFNITVYSRVRVTQPTFRNTFICKYMSKSEVKRQKKSVSGHAKLLETFPRRLQLWVLQKVALPNSLKELHTNAHQRDIDFCFKIFLKTMYPVTYALCCVSLSQKALLKYIEVCDSTISECERVTFSRHCIFPALERWSCWWQQTSHSHDCSSCIWLFFSIAAEPNGCMMG